MLCYLCCCVGGGGGGGVVVVVVRLLGCQLFFGRRLRLALFSLLLACLFFQRIIHCSFAVWLLARKDHVVVVVVVVVWLLVCLLVCSLAYDNSKESSMWQGRSNLLLWKMHFAD